MQAFSGLIFHSMGGIAAGSFYMPFNKVAAFGALGLSIQMTVKHGPARTMKGPA